MTFEVLENKIRQRFHSKVVVPNKITVVFDNQDTNKNQQGFWCRVNFRPGETFQADLGAKKRFRTPGLLIIQIFDDVGKGTKTINQLVDAINKVFRAITVDGVTYQTPNVAHIGQNEGFYQVNVNCPWYSDDVES